MSKPKLFVQLLIDRTGSMQSDWSETISALNAYVERLITSEQVEARIGLAFFDSSPPEPVMQWKPEVELGAWTPLSDKDPQIFPRGMTPLFDAIAAAAGRLRTRPKAAGEREQLVIMTDGRENASKETTVDAVRKIIAELEASGVPATFLGAGLDAFSEGERIGTVSGRRLRVGKSKLSETFILSASKSERYGVSGSAEETEYDASERASLSDEDDRDR